MPSAHLREDALDDTVATYAAAALVRPLGRRAAPALIERAVVARTRELRPWLRPLPDEEWTELCQLMGILARFEQYYRAGPQVLPLLTEPLIEHGQDLHALAAAMIKPATLKDLEALGRATVADHGHIRDADELFIGPSFAQSDALGGADADVVYDGTLLDFKSSAQGGIVGRLEAWQLLGYLFADTDNVCHINRVGVAALRRRRTLIWPAQELIDALAGGPVAGVEHWRAEFTALLESLARAYAASMAQITLARAPAMIASPEIPGEARPAQAPHRASLPGASDPARPLFWRALASCARLATVRGRRRKIHA
ncbi:MAG: hypothetical protein ACLP01_30090 [Solirubrobacteraceae bacterium]